MGLLDDAIREHLELKRLRGADPSAVAREERDALGPVPRNADADHGEEEASNKASPIPGGTYPDAEALVNDQSTVGQETIEINMEAELAAGTEGHEQEVAPPKRAPPAARPARTPASTEESLEWEVPGDHSEIAEAESGDEADSRAGDDGHIEDVLEETPDFLRDTPEQERLWFEQRPPRDFDFNE